MVAVLVGVQGVDDDVHQTIHLRLELVFLGRFSHLGPVSITETVHNLLGLALSLFGSREAVACKTVPGKIKYVC
jgi:hypothetical protein